MLPHSESRRRARRLWQGGVTACVVICLAVPAWANPKCAVVTPSPLALRHRVITDSAGRKKFVIDDALVICSRPAKPEVVYLVQPRAIRYAWDHEKPSFLLKIVWSVREPAFADADQQAPRTRLGASPTNEDLFLVTEGSSARPGVDYANPAFPPLRRSLRGAR
jgi:hypothetical protein